MVGRQDGMNCAPCKFAMPDLAPLRAPHATRLANGEGWKIVVQQKGFFVGSLQGVDKLLVFAGAERGNHQRLRLATREKCRTMRTRQDSGLAYDGTNRLHVATIDAHSGIKDV